MIEREGVIKFDLTHRAGAFPAPFNLNGLQRARRRLFEAGLVGQDPARYDGLGYGNLSERVGPGGEFVISGTQTGGKPELDASDYAWVLEADVAHNRLRSTGETKPSSESLTHALLYQLSRDVVSVVHVHCPRLWGAATRLSLPCTPASAPYGSLAMVDAVRRLWQSGALQQTPGFIMLGHQDGVVSFGADPESATEILFDWLEKI